MEGRGISNEVDDRGAESGIVEIGKTVVVIGHHELFQMGIAVNRP
jgi:hypothetical protein